MAVAKRKKDPAAVALGRRGGKKGGPARAAKLTPAQRSESARKAVQARWSKAGKYEAAHVAVRASDRAVLDLLSRIKATKDHVEIRNLSNQLERAIFHKQYSHS
jgi:hypothetical protein